MSNTGGNDGAEASGSSTNLGQLFEAFLRRMDQVAAPAPPATISSEVRLRHFKALKPPVFKGDADPAKAELWLQNIQKTFRGMGCSDEEKKRLAVYQLEDSANDWWEQVIGQIGEAAAEAITWSKFKEMFLEKYFSEGERRKKEAEFMFLAQGTRTVAQYQRKFDSLSRFASHMVATEKNKVWKFIHGLHDSIQSLVIPHADCTYEKVVSIATSLEARNQVVSKAADDRDKKWGSPTDSDERKLVVGPNTKKDHENAQRGEVRCYNCGKIGHTRNNCRELRSQTSLKFGVAHRRCYKCGEIGHVQRDCRKQMPTLSQDENPAKKAKLNAVEEEATIGRDIY